MYQFLSPPSLSSLPSFLQFLVFTEKRWLFASPRYDCWSAFKSHSWRFCFLLFPLPPLPLPPLLVFSFFFFFFLDFFFFFFFFIFFFFFFFFKSDFLTFCLFKSGWLTKKGATIKTWKKRWFVLKGKCLYYFPSKAGARCLGVIPIPGHTVDFLLFFLILSFLLHLKQLFSPFFI